MQGFERENSGKKIKLFKSFINSARFFLKFSIVKQKKRDDKVTKTEIINIAKASSLNN